MSISPYRVQSEPSAPNTDEPERVESGDYQPMGDFSPVDWSARQDEDEVASPGGRQVLGWALALLAVLWTGYTAWSAGRVLSDQPLSSPAVAQWVAILTGPLALMGLVWMIFGRTRRKEAERFTRSVVAMRTEARSLHDLLGAMSRQIEAHHQSLGHMAGELVGLGDQTATKLGAVTADLDAGSRKLAEHGAALDRAAEAARSDIGVILADLPQAEAVATRMAATLRDAGQEASAQAAGFEQQVDRLAAGAKSADTVVHEASERLLTHLTHIESAGAAASLRLNEAGSQTAAAVDALLARAADALSEVRSGIDTQAEAVTALIAQSQASIGRAGIEASELLGQRLSSAGSSLDGLSSRIAEQERLSQRMISELDAGLVALDERFFELAKAGDERASHVQVALNRLRGELEQLTSATAAQDGSIDGLAQRTANLQEGVGRLGLVLQDELAKVLGDAEESAARVLHSAEAARPHLDAMRSDASVAAERIEAGATNISEQQDRLAALMTTVDLGVGQAEQRLAELSAAIVATSGEAGRLSGETGPALVAALMQVREAASHAAERAREAIAKIIPDSADHLGRATREALEAAVREGVESKLIELDQVATRAVETAREASDRLTSQMLSIGQSASALEAHIERNREAQRKDSGEEFARRVSLLMDSMNSASIDVQKILSDEVDEKAWTSYLKGNRGIFTRRAVRLLDNSEGRPIAAQYESDVEFKGSVDRYVHDFESMLRRVLAERDGGMIAVTLMSSDMGKLYAALAQAVERRR
ncbi:hypothetical protein SH584_00300 [Sphingomonas sp. LY29]|uniref:hypothetical protein n=1 Tax=Sphingomonas sp. LY29 TaxID=3095341 RepID=UPI002D77B387|nr:hypothetical protein [Sphingomonas sp. LY29]WRP25928.1 hypothetical protein SH584_00300 [Sphingomonas sp. LY29]